MINFNYVLILITVCVSVCGQLLFKLAAKRLTILPGADWTSFIGQNVVPIALVVLACIMYFLSTLSWVQVLRSVPLSVAYMFNALGFVLVPAVAFMFFGEPTPKRFLLGLVLIVCGIFFTTQQ